MRTRTRLCTINVRVSPRAPSMHRALRVVRKAVSRLYAVKPPTVRNKMLWMGWETFLLKKCAETRDRTGDLQIFGLTLSQLSYRGLMQTSQRCLLRRSARMRVLLGQKLAFHVEQSQ